MGTCLHSSKIRVAMAIFFTNSKANPARPRWVYILCDKQEKPVNVTSKYGKHNDCKWRIVRLTTSEKEAVEFFGKSMDPGKTNPGCRPLPCASAASQRKAMRWNT